MFKRVLSSVSRAVTAVLFPPVCSFCNAAGADSDSLLCPSCVQTIKWVEEPFCSHCGRVAAGLVGHGPIVCGACLAAPPAYGSARYGAYYEAELRKAIIRFKFYGALHQRRPLSHVLIQAFHRHFEGTAFDVIVPVPIHRSRLISRGFNQVVALTEQLSRETGITLDRTSLRKIKETAPQVGLTRAQRIENLRGSMAVVRPEALKGKTVLLVDDVATSGATIRETSKILKRAGASHIHCLVLALRSDLGHDRLDFPPDDQAPLG